MIKGKYFSMFSTASRPSLTVQELITFLLSNETNFGRYEAEITILHENEFYDGDEELALSRYHGFMAISLLVQTKAHAWNEGFAVRLLKCRGRYFHF